jgi:hypothetical protein
MTTTGLSTRLCLLLGTFFPAANVERKISDGSSHCPRESVNSANFDRFSFHRFHQFYLILCVLCVSAVKTFVLYF